MDKLRGSGYERLPPKSRRTSNPIRWLAIILALLGFFFAALNHFNIKVQIVSAQTEEGLTCRAPLPTLFATHPPEPDSPGFEDAALALDALLSARTAASDIDSLSIAVVGPNGPIFERGYGVLRANESETQNSGSVTRDSIYRIASITKMFTTLETLILRERGALNWDDPVTKFLPNFTYPSYGWAEFMNGDAFESNQEAPITLRQLASHLSGIGRDYPPQDVGETWPAPFPESLSSRKVVQRSQGEKLLLDAVAKYPLVAPQFTFPVYSNTGFDVLGLCNVAANALATGKESNFRELMQRDIFEPLRMSSSFYEMPDESLAAKMAIPASYSDWADYTFELDNDPSGGQYSSLSDLMTVMQSFLSPNEASVISPYVLREWLRPMHAWSDGFYEVGAPWEMIKVGKEARAYAKGGNLPGYHSQFVVNPQWSYGVIVLVTGNYTDTATLAHEAIAHYQPAFENLLLARALDAYGGVWIGDGSVAVVVIQDGALYLQALFVRDQDILALLQSGLSGKPPAPNPKPVALWSTGRPHEFRLAIGRPELNELPTAGCEPYWISLDLPFSRGAPLDLLYWEGSDLVYPSAGVRLQRL
ncbi:beta-lactamase/transpeptidase-like protein [Roridomyces roridus]|uniref:Beta-lactamase/transpeptidase-like protein n=1 Tax=Roridomyces roridus TaxID=1738132 RepID=A0AAD7BV34_9AGAR|nr:beta-lactamase/transpeptidase-like protein [Roridomyces roridus]